MRSQNGIYQIHPENVNTNIFFSKYKCLKENATNIGIFNLQYYYLIYRCFLRQKGRFSVHKNKECSHLPKKNSNKNKINIAHECKKKKKQ